MKTRFITLVLSSFASLSLVIASIVAAQSPEGGTICAVTLSTGQSVSGAPWSDELDASRYWYGSQRLTALLPSDGKWVGMGSERMFGDKFWWWRLGYSVSEEPKPNLKISAVRLDGAAPVVEINNATNAFGAIWQSMLVGMEFPSAGCWEVTGTYNESEKLVFVLQVGA